MVLQGELLTTIEGVIVMNNISTIEQLKKMRLTAMAAEFETQLRNPLLYSELGFEERFGLMTDAEWNRRQTNKLKKCIRDAKLDIPSAVIEEIEYHADRKLDKGEMIRFSTCKYIDEEHHIILKGATGSGKTYIACALGNAACRKYKSVKYIRMPELLDELQIARTEGFFEKTIKNYGKLDLLILDEWLIRCLSQEESYDLLEIIEKRSKYGSTIFCTQYETNGWYKRIASNIEEDNPIADAIMDRIINNSYIVSIEGKISMRERHGLNYIKKAGGKK